MGKNIEPEKQPGLNTVSKTKQSNGTMQQKVLNFFLRFDQS